jgi:hypothetical protein
MLSSAVAALLVAGNAGSLPVPETTYRAEDWETTIADDDAGTLAFRAMTTEDSEQPDTLVLALDRLPDECDSVLISMSVVGSEAHGLPAGLLSPSFLGELQVDRRTPRSFDYRFLTDPRFNNVILVQLTGWEGGDSLVPELRQGRELQFRFVLDGEPHSWQFSLIGVSDVLEHTYEACVSYASNGDSEDVPMAKLSEQYSL